MSPPNLRCTPSAATFLRAGWSRCAFGFGPAVVIGGAVSVVLLVGLVAPMPLKTVSPALSGRMHAPHCVVRQAYIKYEEISRGCMVYPFFSMAKTAAYSESTIAFPFPARMRNCRVEGS